MKLRDEQLRTLKDLINKVKHENSRQVSKWGVQEEEISDWMLFIAEEYGELAGAVAEMKFRTGTKHDVIMEGIQLATLALKLVEMVDQQVE